MSNFETEAVARRLRAHRDRIEAVMKLIEGKHGLTREEKDVARLHDAELKEDLEGDQKRVTRSGVSRAPPTLSGVSSPGRGTPSR
jgi:hypothetical protein